MTFWTGKDAVGREVSLKQCPVRVISLVPSQTELLVDLGIGERLVGRTRYCIHPQELLSKVPLIGGTKKVDLELIQKIQPDLILAEKEENPREWVEALEKLAPVYVTDVVSIASAILMCAAVGELIGLAPQGQKLATQIQTSMDVTRGLALKSGQAERVLYLIWKKPWMAAGRDTFIDSCLSHLGFENVAATLSTSDRYPVLDEKMISELRPDRVFLSSEPYPFKEHHMQEFSELLPHARVEQVDGELFSWYGSRMLKMPNYWRETFSR